MDWLFDHLGRLAPVVVFLIYMISSMKGKGRPEEDEPDPQAAERARRIQEEIRRKILERQRADAGPSGRPPEPLVFEEPEEEVVVSRPVVAPPRREPVVQEPVVSAYDRADSYEDRRREIEAKLEEAKRMRQVAKDKAKSIAKGASVEPVRERSIYAGEIRTRLLEGVGDRNSLKTAILLREVLDTPVGMR